MLADHGGKKIPLFATFLCAATVWAQTDGVRFHPFPDFVRDVRKADWKQFAGRTSTKVTDAHSFKQMKEYILNLYNGVSVEHSYVLNEQTFDCIPIAQQPGVRNLGGGAIATQPPGSVMVPPDGRSRSSEPGHPTHQPPDRTGDAFGNVQACEAGTIPMQRVTLQQLVRFKALREFLRKDPSGLGRAPAL